MRIVGEDVHHIYRVMRYQPGDRIICNNEHGKAAECCITSVDEKMVEAEVVRWLDQSTELPIHVTIAQGIPKGDKLELVLQKGTELGAHSFLPFQAERSISIWDGKKTSKKMARFSKIVKEASEQSHRNKVPDLGHPVSVKELIEISDKYDAKIFAYEEEAKVSNPESFASVVKTLGTDSSLLVCIGPEGGFSPEEAEKLKANGFQPVRLGPRILRTETAALYVLAAISYHFEELRWNECQQ